MAELTVQEQLILELINRARLDPAGEAARLNIGLNQGIPASSTITASAKGPLAHNTLLNDAASAHSNWMLATDNFSHTGSGGTSATQRMANAGYVFTGNGATGENIAYVGTTGAINLNSSALQLHNNLFRSSGHRGNILSDDFREIGLGLETGVFDGFNAAMLTEKFARSGGGLFITGIAINDTDGDVFFDIGEQRAGVSVSVAGGGATTTATAGGYAIGTGGGTHTVTFSGGGLPAAVSATIVVASHNAKLDLVGDTKFAASVTTTLGANATHLTLLGVANIGGTGNGLDNTITGNKGNNLIAGADGVDFLRGMAGNDNMFGGLGLDTLVGGAGRDTLNGGADRDIFDFNAISESRVGVRDRITDFQRGTDDIDLSTLDANTRAGGNQSFKFIGSQPFHDRPGELHIVKAGAAWRIEGDINGDGRADFAIDVVGAARLVAGDFIL